MPRKMVICSRHGCARLARGLISMLFNGGSLFWRGRAAEFHV
jgi:hypothetical protein